MRRTLITVISLAALAQTAGSQPVYLMPSISRNDGSAANVAPLSSSVRVSAQKGLDWLLAYKGNVNWFTVFVLRDINQNYCRSSELDVNIAKKIQELPGDQAASALRRLIDGDTGFAHLDSFWRRLGSDHAASGLAGARRPGAVRYPSEALALMALYCDVRPLPEQAERQIFEIGSATGKTLPNLFAAMVFLEKMGCKSREKDKDFRTIFQAGAEKLAGELGPQKNRDIYEEPNVGLLEFAGYPELVEEEWIRNIISWQLVSGAWSGREHKPEAPDPYSTSVALWALARYLNECPLAVKTFTAPGP